MVCLKICGTDYQLGPYRRLGSGPEHVACVEGGYATAGAIQIWMACVTNLDQGVILSKSTAEGHAWVRDAVATMIWIDVVHRMACSGCH